MSTSTRTKPAAQNSSKSGSGSGYEHREDSGSMFYDEPGVPTLTGSLKHGKTYKVTGEPQIDKNQRSYIKITGDGVSGALYENERKEQERHPDYTGPIEIGGDKMRVSAWKKKTQSGKNAGSEFLSLAFSFPRQQEG